MTLIAEPEVGQRWLCRDPRFEREVIDVTDRYVLVALYRNGLAMGYTGERSLSLDPQPELVWPRGRWRALIENEQMTLIEGGGR